jgi:hypothetical protein
MTAYTETPQIEESYGFDFLEDDEIAKAETEMYYDDLAEGLPLDSSYEF